MAYKPASEDDSPNYPRDIVAFLRGMRILLMGFENSTFVRIAKVLSAAGATAVQGSCEPDALAACHLLIASVSALAKFQPRPAEMPPLLIVGSADNIVVHLVGQPLIGVDFMTTPWTPSELIIRVFRLASSSPRGKARVEGNPHPRILIADDDPDMANLLRMTLDHYAECKVVGNGLAAMQTIRRDPPDVLILDVYMPILGGFDVLQTIRNDPGLRRLPVILLTASDDVADIRRGIDLSANDYIVKPFGVNALVTRIRHVLNGSMGDEA